MQVDCCKVGPLATNCYVARKGDTALVVDPGDEAALILSMLGGAVPGMIVVTHAHFDHIGALAELVETTGAPVAAHASAVERLRDPETPMFAGIAPAKPIDRVDVVLEDGASLEVGDMSFAIMHTPGHAPSSICLYSAQDGVLFSGDTLFRGTCGRTDFEGGDPAQMARSLMRLAELPPETKVYPGHDFTTTIGNERPWISRL